MSRSLILVAAAVVLLGGLAACEKQHPKPKGQANVMVGVRQITVRGVTYKVRRKSGTKNYFQVATVGGRPGTKHGAAQAVIKAHNCARANMTETGRNWSAAEGHGSFCKSKSYWGPQK